MSLRIAFDLDGTLADMESALLELLLDRRGKAGAARSTKAVARARGQPGNKDEPEHDDSQPVTLANLTASQHRRQWSRARKSENFWQHLPETEPGTVGRLAALASERRWDVVFLTSRPPTAGASTEVQTRHWLERHGFPAPGVFVVTESRGRLAASLSLDLVVDDRPENCLDTLTAFHDSADGSSLRLRLMHLFAIPPRRDASDTAFA